MGKIHVDSSEGKAEPKVKLVEIIRDPEAAKLISDPMRRAILNLLRQRSLTEAELAESLGLTDATVSYHLQLLKKVGFITIAKREEEGHGIMQKFYAPTAYLYLPDVGSLPREVARYFYPINIERARGVLSVLGDRQDIAGPNGRAVDKLGEDLAKALVTVARRYSEKQVSQGEGEALVGEIYSNALSELKRLK
jgi:DNA-binding transcriptional ArsR family regulator